MKAGLNADPKKGLKDPVKSMYGTVCITDYRYLLNLPVKM